MAQWSLVVPVKRLERAKTRLRATLPGADHDALVLAMALDTVAAALDCPQVGQVVVVTDDPQAAPALTALGAVCVPDEPDAGLNPALRHGAARAAARRPGCGVAALGSDLPALRPAELARALAAAAAAGAAYVADAGGTGTTLLASRPGAALCPAYGPASAAAHAAGGAVALVGDWPSLRRDVDTADDLAAALHLGAGPHLTALLGGTVPGMPIEQGTVHSFDPGTRAGSVLLDDGTEVPFDAAAFDAGGLRLLRSGQRVRFDRGRAGAISRITVLTLQ